jgi:hypothetical protein
MGASTYLLNAINDLIFRGTSYPAPSTLILELWDASAETTYAGYSAQTISSGTGNWDAASTVSGVGTITPSSTPTFPALTHYQAGYWLVMGMVLYQL